MEKWAPGRTSTIGQAIAAGGSAGSTQAIGGVDFDGAAVGDERSRALEAAAGASAVVVCLGEAPYAEKPGDLRDGLGLPPGLVAFVADLAAATTAPIVTVLVQGRPRLLGSVVANSAAVLWSGLPGPLGAEAIADALFGATNSFGRLPFTYPVSTDLIAPYFHKPSFACAGDNLSTRECAVQWPFGAGLSYTTFETTFALSSGTVSGCDVDASVDVSVSVTNIGAVSGDHVVLVFLTDVASRVSPEYKLLKRFQRLDDMAPGATRTVTFSLVLEDLTYVGLDMADTLEAGEFLVAVGPDLDCRVPDATSGAGCVKFTLEMGGCAAAKKTKKGASWVGLGQVALTVFLILWVIGALCVWSVVAGNRVGLERVFGRREERGYARVVVTDNL